MPVRHTILLGIVIFLVYYNFRKTLKTCNLLNKTLFTSPLVLHYWTPAGIPYTAHRFQFYL